MNQNVDDLWAHLIRRIGGVDLTGIPSDDELARAWADHPSQLTDEEIRSIVERKEKNLNVLSWKIEDK